MIFEHVEWVHGSLTFYLKFLAFVFTSHRLSQNKKLGYNLLRLKIMRPYNNKEEEKNGENEK